MSGGHFDYKQYYIDDIADSIEREIEEFSETELQVVWEDSLEITNIKEEIELFYNTGIIDKSFDEIVGVCKGYKPYTFIREYEEEGNRIAEFKKRNGSSVMVKEHRNQTCKKVPGANRETIQIMNDAVKALRKAAIYAQRIDWFLSGDDGEETFKKRLAEDLKKLEEQWEGQKETD